MTSVRARPASAGADGPPDAAARPTALAAAAFLLSSAALVGLSLLVPDYIRPTWRVVFALSGVPCVVAGLWLLLRRRLAGAGAVAVVLYGDAAIVLSAFASEERVGTTAAALLTLPTLFTATFLRPVWLLPQALLATVGAFVIVVLVPAGPAVVLVRVVVIVTAVLCPAVIVALLRRHLDRAVVTDPLTGLLNRRGLLAGLPEQVARSRRSGAPVGLLLVDVDHFKTVNDSLGHVVGDEVLRVVARTLAGCCPPASLAVRVGGEELAVVATGSEAELAVLAEQVRRAVEVAAAPWGVTVSVGGAVLGAPGPDAFGVLDALLRSADARLYEAKRTGRNRVLVGSVTVGAAASAGVVGTAGPVGTVETTGTVAGAPSG